MNTLFAETLKKLRTDRGLSRTQLAKQMFVNNSTVTRWENGSRLPDAAMITRLTNVLEVEVRTLLSAAVGSNVDNLEEAIEFLEQRGFHKARHAAAHETMDTGTSRMTTKTPRNAQTREEASA